MGKLLLLILLALAVAPGCCVLSLHPLSWVDASEPSSTQLVASQGIPTDVASSTVAVSNTIPPSVHPGR
jgi:hypothetical protein